MHCVLQNTHDGCKYCQDEHWYRFSSFIKPGVREGGQWNVVLTRVLGQESPFGNHSDTLTAHYTHNRDRESPCKYSHVLLVHSAKRREIVHWQTGAVLFPVLTYCRTHLMCLHVFLHTSVSSSTTIGWMKMKFCGGDESYFHLVPPLRLTFRFCFFILNR